MAVRRKPNVPGLQFALRLIMKLRIIKEPRAHRRSNCKYVLEADPSQEGERRRFSWKAPNDHNDSHDKTRSQREDFRPFRRYASCRLRVGGVRCRAHEK